MTDQNDAAAKAKAEADAKAKAAEAEAAEPKPRGKKVRRGTEGTMTNVGDKVIDATGKEVK